MKKAEIPRIKLKNTDKQPIFKRFKAEHFEKSAVFVFLLDNRKTALSGIL